MASLFVHPPEKLLIVLHGAIGDVVRGLPVATRLKSYWPGTKIHWAVEPPSREIVRGHPAIDKVIEFYRPGGIRAFYGFLRQLREERYDAVLDLQRHFKSAVVSRSTGAPFRLGFHRQGSREGNWLFHNHHIKPHSYLSSKIEQFQCFCDYLGIPPMDPLEFGLAASQDELSRVKDLVTCETAGNSEITPALKYVVMLVGSTWSSRMWPVAYYSKLACMLKEHLDVNSIVIGSNKERALGEQILHNSPPGTVCNLAGRTTLRDVAALCSLAAAGVGVDSGPMHIAAAVSLPLVSLWGSTSYERSAPYGQRQHVLDSGLGCSPCYRRECPGLGCLCMREIPPEAVFARLKPFL